MKGHDMILRRTLHLMCCGMALAALASGGVLVVAYGFSPPSWLLVSELAVLSVAALFCGFSGCVPRLRPLLPWLRLRSVRGALLICLGVTVVYVPPQFVFAAVFLGLGIKMVWAEACELTQAEKGSQAAGAERVRVTAQRAEGLPPLHEVKECLPVRGGFDRAQDPL
jgi:hypothetical protein